MGFTREWIFPIYARMDSDPTGQIRSTDSWLVAGAITTSAIRGRRGFTQHVDVRPGIHLGLPHADRDSDFPVLLRPLGRLHVRREGADRGFGKSGLGPGAGSREGSNDPESTPVFKTAEAHGLGFFMLNGEILEPRLTAADWRSEAVFRR